VIAVHVLPSTGMTQRPPLPGSIPTTRRPSHRRARRTRHDRPCLLARRVLAGPRSPSVR